MNSKLLNDFKAQVQNSTEYASNSLAIVTKILSLLSNLNIPIHRKLLGSGSSEFPSWLRPADRRLLQDDSIVPNVTVAKDGSGHCLTIKEAVDKLPKKSTSRFIIYVKEGTYVENVVMDKSKWNVMVYGDGKDKTVVSGSRNFVDGTPTFSTATFGKYILSVSLSGLSFPAFSSALRVLGDRSTNNRMRNILRLGWPQ